MRRAVAALIALLLVAPASARAANGGLSAGSGGTAPAGGETVDPTSSGGTVPNSTGGTTVDPSWVPSAGSGPEPERTPEPTDPGTGGGDNDAPRTFAPRDIPRLYLK